MQKRGAYAPCIPFIDFPSGAPRRFPFPARSFEKKITSSLVEKESSYISEKFLFSGFCE
jgi:hypothetical protein